MTRHQVEAMPVAAPPIPGTDTLHTQFAALCWRMRKGRSEILMITSRRTGRWIIPKGWPIEGRDTTASVLTEAWEEAGVTGRVAGPCLGLFSYIKILSGGGAMTCLATVWPVEVTALARDYPEKDERKRKWMRPKKAAARVDEPELAQMLRTFDPARACRRGTAARLDSRS